MIGSDTKKIDDTNVKIVLMDRHTTYGYLMFYIASNGGSYLENLQGHYILDLKR